MHRRRAIRAWESFWPSLLVWLPLTSFLIATGAALPNSSLPTPRPIGPRHPVLDFFDRPGVTLGILVIVAEFLIIKSLLMSRHYRQAGEHRERYGYHPAIGPDYLALSIIAANVAFATIYVLSILLFLNQSWALLHPVEVRTITNIARLGLVVVLAWGGYQLLSVPDPDGDTRLSRLGVAVTIGLVLQLLAVFFITR